MARIRTIKPEFPQSESMGAISRDARLCFIMMWTIADDAGRLRGNSRMLASLLFPYDDDAPSLIEGWLSELEQTHSIVRYEVDGSTYIQISKWLEHQKIDHASKSRLPEFDGSSRTFASPRDTLAPDLGPRTMDQGPGKNQLEAPSTDDAPKPVTKGKSNDRGTRLAPDWQPDSELRAFAIELGLDPGWEAGKFRDYWVAKAGKDGCKLDWSATWRGWCRRSAEQSASRTHGGRQPEAGKSDRGILAIARSIIDTPPV